MRVVFAGSPKVARGVAQALVDNGVECVGVISQPDRPVGRKKTITPTPVSQWATEHGLPLARPTTAMELTEALQDFAPDLVVTVAYGRMISQEQLDIPPHGWWNVHFSLLPAYRGATPVQHALLAGERTTGVTVFRIDEGLDTGPIIAQEEYAIDPFVSAGELLMALGDLGSRLVVRAVGDLATNDVDYVAQTGTPSYAPKLAREAGNLDWAVPVAEVFRRWQAVTPEPGAYTTLSGTSTTLRILQARPAPDVFGLEPGEVSFQAKRVLVGCSRGALELQIVQPSGKKAMPAADWWRGVTPPVRCG